MKYMGSKKNMLLNGLGETFYTEIGKSGRVIDLFCGSASVSWFIAQNFPNKVVSIDLQEYSSILANAVLRRTSKLDGELLWDKWKKIFQRKKISSPLYKKARILDEKDMSISSWSNRARDLCSNYHGGIVWNSYGGHYYSPSQAIILDLLVESIPFEEPIKYVSMASIISSASKCAAAPGHTAQPFKPNETAGPYLKEAWEMDPIKYTKEAFFSISNKYALKEGEALVENALIYVEKLNEDDLVFIDPPYSSVQYSRFYHVLETIARGECGEISGVGRYPPFEERPVSSFSRRSESKDQFKMLIKLISEKGSKIILTYPDKECSNGLSGDMVHEISTKYFKVKKYLVDSIFSTMGGNNIVRSSRKNTNEMILVLKK